MANLILFDDPLARNRLLPLTFTRPIAELRCGFFLIREKWEANMGMKASWLTEPYLSKKFPAETSNENLYVNASILPDASVVNAIQALATDNALVSPTHKLIALRTSAEDWTPYEKPATVLSVEYTRAFRHINGLLDLVKFNPEEIAQDFKWLINIRPSEGISDKYSVLYAQEQIFVGKNVSVSAAILNAEAGPIILANNSIVQEGAIIQGPCAVGEYATVALGAKIRPGTTIGPHCKVGGEVKNSIFLGHSNKAHDGYIGNSAIGEWCNLGANTNCSNLKNTLGNVKLYSYSTDSLINSESRYAGLFMGDFSKAGISTMFTTGTVVGVSANVFGAGFQAKHVPSFSWGGLSEGYCEYEFSKSIQVIEATLHSAGHNIGEEDHAILTHIAEATRRRRNF